MIKYYCSKCMLLHDQEQPCMKCGNSDLKHISISVQNQVERQVEGNDT